MGLLSIMGNSFRCSASGERLVSAARDGDLQEAKALLEYNPRLVRYSTFGVRNSPLHYSAAQGHNEVTNYFFTLQQLVSTQLGIVEIRTFGNWNWPTSLGHFTKHLIFTLLTCLIWWSSCTGPLQSMTVILL